MDHYCFLLLWTWCLLSGVQGFNFASSRAKVYKGSADAQFGYSVQQHQAEGHQWLLVGAPLDTSDGLQTGDVYRCPLDASSNSSCSRLSLGSISLDNVSERKAGMRLGMSLVSNPEDNSFLACGPLWSHECGSSFYGTGICSRINHKFKLSSIVAPALQRCETFMDIVIVLDGSNSIYPWSEVQEFLINVLQRFYMGPGQTQVGVVQYGSRVVHEVSLRDHQSVEDLLEAAWGIEQRGGEETRTALGINVARSEAFQRGGRPGAQKVMIVITDGESHDSPDLVQAVGDSKADNITMYAIAVLGYYNRRGINPEAFLKEIRFIASDPDEQHFFNVSDESALKDIVDALGDRIFSLEGTSSAGQGFGLQMAQAGFSSQVVQGGVLLGAPGAYDWTGAVLKQNQHGKMVPLRSSYQHEFPEELKNHAAYLGYALTSVTTRGQQLYVGGAPRFNHTGKVIVFTMATRDITVTHSLLGEQIGSYFGGVLSSIDVDGDGNTDLLLVAAPMYYSQGWERGRVYLYSVTAQSSFVLDGVLEPTEPAQNSRLGAALAGIPDMNGDGFAELVVGAPLEDDHQGAIYIFYGQNKHIQHQYKQRLPAAEVSRGLQYLGQSLHGVLDVNGDGLVDLIVGSLGAVVLLWSRGVARLQPRLLFKPERVDVFTRACHRGGRDVSCLSITACLRLQIHVSTGRRPVGVWYTLRLDERRVVARAILDEKRQPIRRFSLRPGEERCQHRPVYVQEMTDFSCPIVVTMEMGLQSPDEGPVLDPDWPTTLRTELPIWNGCEQEDSCRPDLVLHTHTDLLPAQQLCAGQSGAWPVCLHQGVWLVPSRQKALRVYVCLENRGENAFRTSISITASHNLQLNAVTMDQSDVQMGCGSADGPANQTSCNVSSPFMRPQTQLSFRLDFEFSRSVFLDHIHVVMETSSAGVDVNPDDNINDLYLPLKYQTDLLFTRDSNPHRFHITPDSSSSSSSGDRMRFNLTFHLQNLGQFPVADLLFQARVWALTRNQLLDITDYSIVPVRGHCLLPGQRTDRQVTPEDLSHLAQLNQSNSGGLEVSCVLLLPAISSTRLSLIGRLHLPSLLAVRFRSLELLADAVIQLGHTNPMFLLDTPVRQVSVELTRQEENRVPVWIILGSLLGGLVLLALLVLLLWKMGFFNRRKTQKEEELTVTNGKTAEDI